MKTWVVVASAARARIFEMTSRKGPLLEHMDLVNPQDRMLRQDIEADRPGSSTDRQGGQRHGVQSQSDPKELQAKRFAKEVVDWLESQQQRKSFDSLYLVSSPHFLGLLRERIGRGLADSIKGEWNKDLTQESVASLQTHLQELTMSP